MTAIPGKQALVRVAAVQVAAGVAGNLLAVHRELPFDIALVGWVGRRDRVLGDSWLFGTGVSAPVPMLVAQAVATTQLSRATAGRQLHRWARSAALMVGG